MTVVLIQIKPPVPVKISHSSPNAGKSLIKILG